MRLWIYGVCGVAVSVALMGLWRRLTLPLGGPPGGGVEAWWQTPRGAGSVEAEDWARWT